MQDERIMELQELRKQRGLTQGDLTRLTGLAQAEISRFETGRALPSHAAAARIARALAIPVEWIPRLPARDADESAFRAVRCDAGVTVRELSAVMQVQLSKVRTWDRGGEIPIDHLQYLLHVLSIVYGVGEDGLMRVMKQRER